MEPLEVLDRPWTDAVALAAAAGRVAQEAESRRKELQSPDKALAETLAALTASGEGLADLGVLFQRGRDKEAFELILGLFTLLEDAGRRAELSMRDRPEDALSWQSFHDDLQPFLKETEAALGSGDYVLLTDLLEYEVCPRLTRLKDQFLRISNLDPVTELL